MWEWNKMRKRERKRVSCRYVFQILYMFGILLCGCSTHSSLTKEQISLGVVGFYHPNALYEIFSGKLFPYRMKATAEEEKELTKILLENVEKKTTYLVKQISVEQKQGEQETPLAYWSNIGKEQGVELLIVPQIMEWKEGGYVRGTYISPKVVIEYYLLDVEKKLLVERSRYYDEYMNTEYDLRYNTPVNGMFFNNRPSCMDLAIDSIYKMLIDFSFVRNRKERNIFAQ